MFYGDKYQFHFKATSTGSGLNWQMWLYYECFKTIYILYMQVVNSTFTHGITFYNITRRGKHNLSWPYLTTILSACGKLGFSPARLGSFLPMSHILMKSSPAMVTIVLKADMPTEKIVLECCMKNPFLPSIIFQMQRCLPLGKTRCLPSGMIWKSSTDIFLWPTMAS